LQKNKNLIKMNKKKTRPYRVLCLDGGGMRGLYTATVLKTLTQRFSVVDNECDIGKGFDLIVGTSTGGILACGIAAGISIETIIQIYKIHGEKIFTHPIPTKIIPKILWAKKNLRHPANINENLRAILKDIFINETLGELYQRRKIGLCLTSVNVATHNSRVFKTAHDPYKNADDYFKLIDICLATSAAPLILPIAEIENPHEKGHISNYVDGGLWANNPVLVGLIEALHVSDTKQAIEIISIGTCPPPSGTSMIGNEAQRGLLGWNFGIKVLELSMDAQSSGHHFMAELLAQYFNRCGREIKILRLEQSSPSSEQALHLGLDNASKKACYTLTELGQADALKIYGKAIGQKSNYNLLNEIFKSMPILETKGEEAI